MPDGISERVERLELPFDARGVDNYGVSRWHLDKAFRVASLLYKSYFQVRCSVSNLSQECPRSSRWRR